MALRNGWDVVRGLVQSDAQPSQDCKHHDLELCCKRVQSQMLSLGSIFLLAIWGIFNLTKFCALQCGFPCLQPLGFLTKEVVKRGRVEVIP